MKNDREKRSKATTLSYKISVPYHDFLKPNAGTVLYNDFFIPNIRTILCCTKRRYRYHTSTMTLLNKMQRVYYTPNSMDDIHQMQCLGNTNTKVKVMTFINNWKKYFSRSGSTQSQVRGSGSTEFQVEESESVPGRRLWNFLSQIRTEVCMECLLMFDTAAVVFLPGCSHPAEELSVG